MKKFAFPTSSGAIVAWVPTKADDRPYLQILAAGCSIALSGEDIDAMARAISAIDDGDEEEGETR